MPRTLVTGLVITLLFCGGSQCNDHSDNMDDMPEEIQTGGITRIHLKGISAGEKLGGALACTDVFTVIGATGNNQNGQNTGAVYILMRKGNTFTERATILHIDQATAEDRFGFSVAIESDILIVGAPDNDKYGKNSGLVFVFQNRIDNEWDLIGELSSTTASPGDRFGYSVDLNNGCIAIGSWQDQENYYDSEFIKKSEGVAQGSVFIYSLQPPFRPVDVLTAIKEEGHRWDGFGQSVSIDKEWIAIGAPGTENTTYKKPGRVYLFKKVSDSWIRQGFISAENGVDKDGFGSSVDLAKDHLVVTAPGNFNPVISALGPTGSAFLFQLENDAWTEKVMLLPNGIDANDGFAEGNIALKDGKIVIGSRQEEVSTFRNGAVYLYESKNNWKIPTRLVAPDPLADDFFGSALSLSNDAIFVGAPRRCNEVGCSAGAVYFSFSE